MKTVHQLRKEGYKIRIQHFRYPYQYATDGYAGPFQKLTPPKPLTTDQIQPEKEFRHKQAAMNVRGGKTTLEISGKEFATPVQVVAFCSTSDNFNRKRGVELCLYRAFGHQKRQERERTKHIGPS